jgi:hypothetical protein
MSGGGGYETVRFAETPLGKRTSARYHGVMYRSLPERTYPPHWRVAAAFILVPAFAALSFAIAMPLYAGLPMMAERIWRSALVYGLIGAYPPAVVIGVPAYFALRRHFDPHFINCAWVGALVATLPWMFLTLVSTPDQASIGDRATVINGSYTAFGWLMNAQFLGEIALAGAIGGALFWVIAAAGSGAGKVR